MKIKVTNIHSRYPIARLGRRFRKGETVELDLRPRQIKVLERAKYLKVEVISEMPPEAPQSKASPVAEETKDNLATHKGFGWYEFDGRSYRKQDLPEGTIIE